jgi:hypothetical protein
METLPERFPAMNFPALSSMLQIIPTHPASLPQRARFFSPITVTPSVYL